MSLSKRQLVDLYRRRAKRHDFTAQLCYLAGFREWAYRKRAVNALSLSPGDNVIELCCGTELNFSLLHEKVGPRGKIVGIDLTDAMLEGARERIHRNRWTNVELVQGDVATFIANNPRIVESVESVGWRGVPGKHLARDEVCEALASPVHNALGSRKIDAIIAVVNRLVEERKALRAKHAVQFVCGALLDRAMNWKGKR